MSWESGKGRKVVGRKEEPMVEGKTPQGRFARVFASPSHSML
jgi:hypothetical protein